MHVYGGKLTTSLSLTTQDDISQPAGARCSILPSSPKPVSEFAATVLEVRGDGSQFPFLHRGARETDSIPFAPTSLGSVTSNL